MSDPLTYDDKKELEPGYAVEGLESDGEEKSFTALIQEGEIAIHLGRYLSFQA